MMLIIALVLLASVPARMQLVDQKVMDMSDFVMKEGEALSHFIIGQDKLISELGADQFSLKKIILSKLFNDNGLKVSPPMQTIDNAAYEDEDSGDATDECHMSKEELKGYIAKLDKRLIEALKKEFPKFFEEVKTNQRSLYRKGKKPSNKEKPNANLIAAILAKLYPEVFTNKKRAKQLGSDEGDNGKCGFKESDKIEADKIVESLGGNVKNTFRKSLNDLVIALRNVMPNSSTIKRLGAGFVAHLVANVLQDIFLTYVI